MTLLATMKFATEMLFGIRGSMPPVGSQAPDFEAVDHLGRRIRLSEKRGRNVLLWFFPKADTPG
jgi:peroxiredoxin